MQSATIQGSRKRGAKLRGGTRLVVWVTTVGLLGYAIWTYGVGTWILSRHFTPLTPGNVSLIGIRRGKNFRIQVSNRMAQLVEGSDAQFGGDPNAGADTDTGSDSNSKRRIPLTDMVGALKGDEQSLTAFFDKLNDLQPGEDWPINRTVWKSEDIEKALAGDLTLRNKLEKDLNVRLDGKPLTEFRASAVEDGIILDVAVPIRVREGETTRTLRAHVQRWFRPKLASETEKKYQELFDVSDKAKAGYYAETAKEMEGKEEDVAGDLRGAIDLSSFRDAIRRTEEMLSGTQVVITDKFMDSASLAPSSIGTASLDEKPKANGMFDLSIHVNSEGRLRLWQYSKQHPNDQLLLISNGIAIAAPRITHELILSNLTIQQMPDQGLAQQAADTINHVKS